jgi:hypothetical protein
MRRIISACAALKPLAWPLAIAAAALAATALGFSPWQAVALIWVMALALFLARVTSFDDDSAIRLEELRAAVAYALASPSQGILFLRFYTAGRTADLDEFFPDWPAFRTSWLEHKGETP